MNFYKTIVSTFLLFLTFICVGNSKSNDLQLYSDSLIRLINTEKDYQKVRLYITDLLNKNYVTNTPFVIQYIEENILDNPKYTSDTIFYANTLNTYAISFLNTDVHKTIEIAKKGIDYIGKSQTPSVLEKLALLQTNLANAMGELGHTFTRLKLYVDIHPIILKTNNPLIIRNYNFRIGGLYYQLNDLDKALAHLYKGIFVEDDFRWHPNFAGIAETLIASVYVKKNNIDSVRKYIMLADNIKREEIPVAYKARIRSIKALAIAHDNKYQQAERLLNEAYIIADQGKETTEKMYSQFVQGMIYAQAKQYEKAIKAYNDVLDNYTKEDLESYTNTVLQSLIDAYKASNQYQLAFDTYNRLLENLKSEHTDNQQLYTEELNYNMKFNEKLAEIEKLKSYNDKALITRTKNKMLIAALFVSVVLLLIVLFLVVKAKERNKMLAKKEYDLLKSQLEEEENARKLDEMKWLKTIEDRERNRIATDLHDSLGGLLSSIKIALFDFQDSTTLTEKEAEHTNRILDYIDETKQELNRIVYNLTPLIVEKFGLLEAIKQYCKKIQTEKLKIDFQLISIPPQLSIEDEITLYRIIQEVLHNIVKHANASHILLQIQTAQSGMLAITLEDNGEGMDLESAKNKGGLGLRSIFSRVQNLNGKISIESQKGEGTSIYITCFPNSLQANAKK